MFVFLGMKGRNQVNNIVETLLPDLVSFLGENPCVSDLKDCAHTGTYWQLNANNSTV